MKELKFYVMADPHFFDTALGCSGKEYEDFMHYEQKCFAETENINKSVFEFLKKANEADIVLIVGDLSFNGEKKSHEGFLKLLYDLKNSGKKIYVVTADHDFKWKREDTFAFGENGRYSPEHTEEKSLPKCTKISDSGRLWLLTKSIFLIWHSFQTMSVLWHSTAI